MPFGKPAGVRCVQLTSDNFCRLFGDDRRPEVCQGLRAAIEMCGDSTAAAMVYLTDLEDRTRPSA